jgi:hypothetical protein
MKLIPTCLVCFALAGGLAVCSKSEVNSGAEAEAAIEVTEITWEDLMPAGEDELLESLYVEFYQEFERNLTANSTPLSQAGTQGADVSTLIREGSADDTMEQIGTFNVVKGLNGKRIRIPGYVVPFDFNADAEHTEFLLVPYFGACLHTPPPPPNQIIFVTSEVAAKIENIEEPVWLEGTLSTGEFLNDLGNSAYELTLSKLEPYAY